MRTGLNRRRLAFIFPADPPGDGGGTGGTGGGGASAPAAGTPPQASAGAPAAGGDTDAERGFPAGTRVVDMTAEQQAAYWKFQSRKHENQVKELGDLGDLRRKAAAWDEHEQANATDVERARREGLEAGKAAVAPQLAEYALRGSLAHLADDKRDAVLAAVDFSKFVGQDGRPDETKIKTFVSTVAPATATPPATPPGGGHGGHRPPGTGSTLSSGRERYLERSGGKKTD